MKRIGKWLLIAFALLVGALAVLFIVKPDTLLLAAILLAMLLNPGPPPIAEGQLAGSNWMHSEETGRKLTAVLERRFPNGTPESDLTSVLLRQGFRPIPPPRADCLPPGQHAPVGVVFTNCPTAEEKERQKRALEYRWGNGVCGDYVQIWWSVDDRQAITRVQGSYNEACL